jgi:hypothetical protein
MNTPVSAPSAADGSSSTAPNSLADEEALTGLDPMAPLVLGCTRSHGGRTRNERPATRGGLWRAAVATAAPTQPDFDMLLGFVPGDDPALVVAESSAVHSRIDDECCDG